MESRTSRSVECSSGSIAQADNDEQQDTTKESFLQKISSTISHSLENGFATFGKKIGANPWKFIIASFMLAALSSIGLLSFYDEQGIQKLWTPEDSWVRINKGRAEEQFPATVQLESIIAVSDNILTPSGIVALLDIYQESYSMSSSGRVQLSDICQRAGSSCLVTGILEIWSFDNATIRSLSQAEINDDIRNTNISPVYGRPIQLSDYLGQMSSDGNGDLIARAAILHWFTEGDPLSQDRTDEWEKVFINLGTRGHPDLINTYVKAGRSWKDESDKAIEDDILLLFFGYIIVGIFVLLAIGKCNLMEQKTNEISGIQTESVTVASVRFECGQWTRQIVIFLTGKVAMAWLTLGGFLCVGFSVIMSIGLASAFGLHYGPVQRVLPFLLLGLGVDDMFIIVGALEDLSPEDRLLDVPKQISLVLKHAGVSITVTSLTDMAAFFMGANTVIPALMSFCIYSGIGIISLYILQCTFFTACLAIDIRRTKTKRDGCCLMIKHKEDYVPNKCSQKQLVPFIFSKGLTPLVAKLPFKIVALLVTVALFGVNVWGFVDLEQKFDPYWFIPTDSYMSKFLDTLDDFFPDFGITSHVYCSGINHWERRTNLEDLERLLRENKYIQNGTTDSWFGALTSWLASTSDPDILPLLNNESYPSTKENFENLTHRLVTQVAPHLNNYLKFVPSHFNITASRFPYVHIAVDSSADKISAMDSVRDNVKAAGFSTDECFPYSFRYLPWETNRIIQKELYRNLGLAMACVFVVTLILIANLFTSTIVFLGVVATLVDVAGSMHFWGLTIDTVTSVILILSIGLAVDYSAHIGHKFMTVKGTREERTKKTIETIGAPVFYGAFTTFLAFVLLSQSNGYIFRTFFKVNFLVVIYGMFHGLIFLPVMLSLVGPAPYSKPVSKPKDPETAYSKGVTNISFTPDNTQECYNGMREIKRNSLGNLYEKSANRSREKSASRSRRQSVSSRASRDYSNSRRGSSTSLPESTNM